MSTVTFIQEIYVFLLTGMWISMWFWYLNLTQEVIYRFKTLYIRKSERKAVHSPWGFPLENFVGSLDLEPQDDGMTDSTGRGMP